MPQKLRAPRPGLRPARPPRGSRKLGAAQRFLVSEHACFGGARGRTDVPKIVDWYMDGKIKIDELITHKLKLEDINAGFDLMRRGESIRSVVVY